jgi:hypothetical protein
MEASPDQSKLIPLKLGKKEGKIHWLYVTYFSPNYRLWEDDAGCIHLWLWQLARMNQGLNGANNTTELCPPNPNELEIAAF